MGGLGHYGNCECINFKEPLTLFLKLWDVLRAHIMVLTLDRSFLFLVLKSRLLYDGFIEIKKT